MNLIQAIFMLYTLACVGLLGDAVKHKEAGHPVYLWVYLIMVAVFLADYAVMGRA